MSCFAFPQLRSLPRLSHSDATAPNLNRAAARVATFDAPGRRRGPVPVSRNMALYLLYSWWAIVDALRTANTD